HAPGDAQGCGAALQIGLERAVTGEPEVKPLDAGNRFEEHIEPLVAMKPAQRQGERRILGRREGSARQRRGSRILGEIRQVMHPPLGPALSDEPGRKPARVADEMIAMTVVAQIVIASEPRNMHEIAARAKRGRAAHPGEHDPWAKFGDRPREARLGHEIEDAAERKLERRQALPPKPRSAFGIAPDDDRLIFTGAIQRHGKALEERLGAAMHGAGHRLEHPRHWRKASKRCATSSGPRPRCKDSAASCWRRHNVSSVNSAIARCAKVVSFAAIKPVTPSLTRSASAPMGWTTAGTPKACASATARQKVSPGSPR